MNREQRRRKKALYAHALTVARDGDVDAVIDLLDSPNYLVRTEAIKAIRRRRLSAAAPRLADAVENDPDVKLGALLALEKLALPESGPTFKRSLEDPELSPVALRGLLAIRDPEAVSAAEAVYHQGGFLARSVALYVLSCAGIQRSQDAFRRLLEAEPSWWSRWRIRKAIRQAVSQRGAGPVNRVKTAGANASAWASVRECHPRSAGRTGRGAPTGRDRVWQDRVSTT